MSLPFSDTSTKKGLVQEYERECGFEYGDVSGNANKLAEFTAAVNVTLDDFIALAIRSDGRWQFDDSNQTDYPVITTNLVAGQRDYPFTVDGSGNLILDFFRVLVASPSGIFTDILPVDVESKSNEALIGAQSGVLYTGIGTDGFVNGQNAQGTPTRYDKMANGLFLDPIPSYNYPGGLKAYVNREASYFAATDTTKKPGVPGIFHKYFYLKPAMTYARRKSLKNYNALAKEVLNLEGDEVGGITGAIAAYFSRRNKDERARLTAGRQSNK